MLLNENVEFVKCYQLHKKGSSTLPRATTRGTETELGRESKVPAATSSTSLYDNVASGNASGQTTAQGTLFLG